MPWLNWRPDGTCVCVNIKTGRAGCCCRLQQASMGNVDAGAVAAAVAAAAAASACAVCGGGGECLCNIASMDALPGPTPQSPLGRDHTACSYQHWSLLSLTHAFQHGPSRSLTHNTGLPTRLRCVRCLRRCPLVPTTHHMHPPPRTQPD